MRNRKQVEAAIAARQADAEDLGTIRRRFLGMISMADRQNQDGCWIWQGGHQSAAGYGMFWYRGRTIGAHRASWLIFNEGEIPPKHVVMHKCDDRMCVNPRHLRLGTHRDNMQDAVDKGRIAFGGRSARTSLDEMTVAAMRGEFIPGRYGELTRIANKYNVKLSTVSMIIHGNNWKYSRVTLGSDPSSDPAHKKAASGANHYKAKLTEENVIDIRTAFALGQSYEKLALQYGVAKPTIAGICSNRTWTNLPSTPRRGVGPQLFSSQEIHVA